MEEINHKVHVGKAIYDKNGIRLLTGFGFDQVKIDWEEIDFCSFTPAVKRFAGKWKDFKGKDLSKLDFLVLHVALKNRHQIVDSVNLLTKFWMHTFFHLKALFPAQGKPSPDKGVLTIPIKLNSLSASREEFIEFISRNSRLGLLVWE